MALPRGVYLGILGVEYLFVLIRTLVSLFSPNRTEFALTIALDAKTKNLVDLAEFDFPGSFPIGFDYATAAPWIHFNVFSVLPIVPRKAN